MLGRGIFLFVHDSLDFKIRPDLCPNTHDCETFSIELMQQSSKNIIVNTVYRPPSGKIAPFTSHMQNIFTENDRKLIYLVGDINLNTLEYDTDNNVKKTFDMFLQSNLVPMINKPTRITRKSASIIDHILTNNLNLGNVSAGIIKSDITDHFPIFIIGDQNDKSKNNNKQPDTTFVRKFTDAAIADFQSTLNNLDWSFLYEFRDPDSAYDYFIKIFLQTYEKSFPKYVSSSKSSAAQTPWITKGLLKSSKKKQRLYEKFLKKRNVKNENKYKTYKNIFNSLKIKAKKAYYSKKLVNSALNIKQQWSVINELMGKNKQKTTNMPQRLIIDDKLETDASKIAENFNNFFVTVGSNLASNLPCSSKDFNSYIKKSDLSIGDTTELSDQELLEALKTLKPNKSAGFDEINVNVIMSVIHQIFHPLKFLFNLSLKYGVFPQNLKIAKVIPIFKKGEKTEVSNYRPISILPCFSKILERIMYNRLYSYIMQHNLLSDSQFGFQAKHSTDHALLKFVQDISDNFEQNMYTVAVFIDLTKAFDTVNHKILLSKLKRYGVDGNYLKLFKSYLSKRKQYVSDRNIKTSYKYVECGVPQGSILGPLLFLLYVNDMQHCSQIMKFILFADDTTLYFSHKNINTLFKIVNSELKKLDEWFKANKLCLI